MSDEIPKTQSITENEIIRQQVIQQKRSEMQNRTLIQVGFERDFEEWCSMGEFTLLAKKRFKPLKDLKKDLKTKKKISKKEIGKVDNPEKSASKFQNQNYELNKKTLILLFQTIKQDDTIDSILKKVLSFYPDPSLADEALDFLIETTKGDLQQKIIQAKKELNSELAREIKAGKNIKKEAQSFSKEGIGIPTSLRNLYREITGKNIKTQVLFDDFAKAFVFEKLKVVLEFLFHALGSDLKSKGPSIDKAELMKLIDTTKDLQAILGLYKFFRSRIRLINALFNKNNIPFPKSINFELLSKAFMKLLTNNFISLDNVFILARELGLSKDVIAQIIIFSQMRDATRNTSLRLYKSKKHRQEVLEAIIDALEEYEERLDEEEEEEEQ